MRYYDIREDALDEAQLALKLCRAAGNPEAEATALNNVGWYHARLGDYRTALEYCREALDLQDRAEDSYRLNLSTNRPPVSEAADRVADYYRQRGQSGPALQQDTGTVLGGFAKVESVAAGFQWGLRFLSLMVLTLGLTVALLLWQAARALRAPPGSGYR